MESPTAPQQFLCWGRTIPPAPRPPPPSEGQALSTPTLAASGLLVLPSSPPRPSLEFCSLGLQGALEPGL